MCPLSLLLQLHKHDLQLHLQVFVVLNHVFLTVFSAALAFNFLLGIIVQLERPHLLKSKQDFVLHLLVLAHLRVSHWLVERLLVCVACIECQFALSDNLLLHHFLLDILLAKLVLKAFMEQSI